MATFLAFYYYDPSNNGQHYGANSGLVTYTPNGGGTNVDFLAGSFNDTVGIPYNGIKSGLNKSQYNEIVSAVEQKSGGISSDPIRIEVDAANFLAFGGNGSDLVTVRNRSDPRWNSDTSFYGRGGDDVFTTGSNRSSVYFDGGEGNDRFIYSASTFGTSNASARFDGGAGVDTAQIDFTGSKAVTFGLASNETDQFVYFFSYSNPGSFSTFVNSIGINTDVERFVITGSAFGDFLTGGNGDDWLDGRGGADAFVGSAGSDSYVFDDLGDRCYGPDDGIDTIWSTVTCDLQLATGVENLRLQSGDIDGTGNALANLITGSTGANRIAGGLGNDSLYGKGGADTFVFAEMGTAHKDSIWDFDANDKIELSKSAFAGLDTNNDGIIDATALNLTGKAAGNNAQVIYNKNTGVLSYDADGAGGAAAEDIAFIGKNLTFLSADHFTLAA